MMFCVYMFIVDNTKIETNVHNRPSNVVKCREDWEKIKRRSGTNKAR